MCLFDDCIDRNSIGRDPLIPVENKSKMRSLSFPRQKHAKNHFGNQLNSESRTSRLSRQGESVKPTFTSLARLPGGLEEGVG